MKPFLLLAALMASFGRAYAQSFPLTAAQIPQRGASLQALVPRGWKIEKTVRGDLNRDKIADAALVLVENGLGRDPNEDPGALKRALVVLLKAGKTYRRAGFNASLLLGTRDGGAFYGATPTPVNVSIKRGVLGVNQESGSREVTETTHKFRFNARIGRFQLIGLEERTRDRVTGSGRFVSTNFLTGRQQIEAFDGPDAPDKRRVKRVSRVLRPLESIQGDERYSG